MPLLVSRLRTARRATAVLLAALAVPAAASAGRITEYPTAGSGVVLPLTDIASAPNGTLWAVKVGLDSGLTRLTTAGVEQPITLTGVASPVPQSIAFGSDGNLWFGEGTQDTPRIVRVDASGAATAFPTGGAVTSLAQGPDGAIWFIEAVPGASDGPDTPKIGRITPSGTVSEFPLDGTGLTAPGRIKRGPDGAMWFTDQAGPVLGRISMSGVVTPYPLPALPENDLQTGLSAGPDGNVWVTTERSIMRVAPTTQAVTVFTDGLSASKLNDITPGKDDNLWFTDVNDANPAIGRITTDGTVRLFPTAASGGAFANAIAAGLDGNLWFAGARNNGTPFTRVIGRVETTDLPSGTVLDGPTVGPGNATLGARVSAEGLAAKARFQYGTTVAYGSATPDVDLSGYLTAPFTQTIANLSPGTTYHYRLVMSNAKGTLTTEDRTFTTTDIPSSGGPIINPVGTVGVTPPPPVPTPPTPGVMKLGATKVKVNSKGIIALPLICTGGSPCAGPIALTAKLVGKRSASIATKPASIAPGGKPTKLNLRLSKAAVKAVKRGGKKGLSTLVAFTQGKTTVRFRLTVVKG